MTTPLERNAARHRDAARILLIIEKAGKPPRGNPTSDCVKVLDAEKRLQALDFWVRYPDYLAHEFLVRYEGGDKQDRRPLEVAAEIMEGTEPELRRLYMLRHLFGAFQVVDDAIARLASHGLVKRFRVLTPDRTKVRKVSYHLTEAGQRTALAMAVQPPLDWYARRAELAAEVAGDDSGDRLKKRQYAVEAYGLQRWGRVIPPIDNEVRERLRRLEEA